MRFKCLELFITFQSLNNLLENLTSSLIGFNKETVLFIFLGYLDRGK